MNHAKTAFILWNSIILWLLKLTPMRVIRDCGEVRRGFCFFIVIKIMFEIIFLVLSYIIFLTFIPSALGKILKNEETKV
jgi:hypothetical protein